MGTIVANNDGHFEVVSGTDLVNHPPHYATLKPEPEEVIEAWGLHRDHYIASALAYIARSPFKGQEILDLKKAIRYINKKITLIEKESLEKEKA